MKYKRSDGYNEIDLLQFGEDHINTAYSLFKFGIFRSFDSAGYLIHVGVEQLLKAWILHIKDEFNDSHNLIGLVDNLGIKNRLDSQTLEKIQSFYELRYPKPSFSTEIGTNDWEKIEQFITTLFSLFPDSLIKEYKALIPSKKGGRIVTSDRELNIKGAAKYLGVTTQTLRNWDSLGKLKPVRSQNGYRSYPIWLLEDFKKFNL